MTPEHPMMPLQFMTLRRRAITLATILLMVSAFAWQRPASADEAIIVQSTTSTQNAGFYRHVLPAFTAESGITVKVVAVGTGQALKNAQNCDGDMLIVHARAAEDAFIAAGYGAQRHDLMYNDFIIVGPQDDPAGLRFAADARDAMRRIQRPCRPDVDFRDPAVEKGRTPKK